MKVYGVGIFIIVSTIYRLAKRLLPKHKNKKGPKTYELYSQIAMVAWATLYGKSYDKVLDDLDRTKLYRKFKLKKAPSKASLSRWRRELRPYLRYLSRYAFFRLMRMKKRKRLIAVVDGTGIKLGRASSHYEERISKKRSYLLVTAVYSPEIDAFFDITATPSYVSELTAFKTYLAGEIISAKIFWLIVTDKKYDDSALIIRLESEGIMPCISARKGQLAPRSGPRARSDKNYRAVRRIYHVRSLIESGFSSTKSFAPMVVRSMTWEGREGEALVHYLAHNVARLVAISKR